MGKYKDCVVWYRSRGKNEELRPFEVDGKEIFSNRSKQAKPKAGEKTDKKGDKGRSVRWKAWWRQGNIKCAVSEEPGMPRAGFTKIAMWQTSKKQR